MQPLQFLALLFSGLGLLMIVLAVPLILGKVKPNPWYGFRIPRTVNNPAVWYPANKRAGWWLVGMGALLIISGPVPALLLRNIPEDLYAGGVAVLLLVYSIMMMIDLFVTVRRIEENAEAVHTNA